MNRARALVALLTLGLSACASVAPPSPSLAPGAHYVAMGSSFAAGPGVAAVATGTPARCSRSTENYAQQLARRLNLRLTDMSCGGATTAHILGTWDELSPQIEALTPDTALVTVTIGGNDVGYIGRLLVDTCPGADLAHAPQLCQLLANRDGAAVPAPLRALRAMPDDAAWQALAASLDRISAEVRRRAPAARLVFVDYLTVVGEGASCPAAPLSPDRAAAGRAVAERLAAETAAAASRAGADIVRASTLSARHGTCDAQPWMTAFIPPAGAQRYAPYHPNQAGMTAVADALAALLVRRRQ